MIDLTPAQSDTLAWLAGRRGYATAGQVADALGITRDAAYNRLEELVELRAVIRNEHVSVGVHGRPAIGYKERRPTPGGTK